MFAAWRRRRNRHEPGALRLRSEDEPPVDHGRLRRHLRDRTCRAVDLVLPDIRFLAKEREKLKGIIDTSMGHEDHYGALNELWPGLNAACLCLAVYGCM